MQFQDFVGLTFDQTQSQTKTDCAAKEESEPREIEIPERFPTLCPGIPANELYAFHSPKRSCTQSRESRSFLEKPVKEPNKRSGSSGKYLHGGVNTFLLLQRRMYPNNKNPSISFERIDLPDFDQG